MVVDHHDHIAIDIVIPGNINSNRKSSSIDRQEHHQQQQQQQQIAPRNASSSSMDCNQSIEAASSAAPRDDRRGEMECRICQEDDETSNLEIPCACCGSLKYAHRKCVQRWCNEKGDTMCEICQQPFKGGYTTIVRPQLQAAGANDLREWDFRDPRLLALERHFLQEYESTHATGSTWCRSAAIILMTLLLLRHTLALGSTSNEEDASTFFLVFLLRAAGFLLPCYIMARVMNMIQRRRQRQEWRTSMLDSSPHRIHFMNFLQISRV